MVPAVTCRRSFVSLLAASAATWPLALRSQSRPAEPHRIGLLSFGSAPGGPQRADRLIE